LAGTRFQPLSNLYFPKSIFSRFFSFIAIKFAAAAITEAAVISPSLFFDARPYLTANFPGSRNSYRPAASARVVGEARNGTLSYGNMLAGKHCR
jgi:hypothetical protein